MARVRWLAKGRPIAFRARRRTSRTFRTDNIIVFSGRRARSRHERTHREALEEALRTGGALGQLSPYRTRVFVYRPRRTVVALSRTGRPIITAGTRRRTRRARGATYGTSTVRAWTPTRATFPIVWATIRRRCYRWPAASTGCTCCRNGGTRPV